MWSGYCGRYKRICALSSQVSLHNKTRNGKTKRIMTCQNVIRITMDSIVQKTFQMQANHPLFNSWMGDRCVSTVPWSEGWSHDIISYNRQTARQTRLKTLSSCKLGMRVVKKVNSLEGHFLKRTFWHNSISLRIWINSCVDYFQDSLLVVITSILL